MGHILTALLLAAEAVALLLLVLRLLPGRHRLPPVPSSAPRGDTTVTVIVATLNEADGIAACLEGLRAQREPLLEVLVVDSNSTDGTREIVQRVVNTDSRFRLITDEPLPAGWIGKVWALEAGRRSARGKWILGIDADTTPMPGMVSAIIGAVQQHNYGAASFAPCFAGHSVGERWLQASMLITLVYRCGAVDAEPAPSNRIMANGQCFVVRRAILETLGGYGVARASFSDDVTLARHLAAHGVRVGFLNGSSIIAVNAYQSFREVWREWGRSFDLQDSVLPSRRWSDVVFVWLTMALPFPVLLFLLMASARAPMTFVREHQLHVALFAVNASLLVIRLYLMYVIRDSYQQRLWTHWVSWLADIPAAVRLTLSTARRPTMWRGRVYEAP